MAWIFYDFHFFLFQAGLQVHAGYGSSKDIAVYQGIGLPSTNIFIVGKVSKKLHKDAIVRIQQYFHHEVLIGQECIYKLIKLKRKNDDNDDNKWMS